MTPDDLIRSVLPLVDAILPGNATPIERAMLAAELAAVADVDPESIPAIWDPYRCPPALLPWLAWALSVDVWDDTWPEAVKRDVIAASPEVHRRKGTRASVERALGAMRLRASLKEWWETAPAGRRGTFEITVYVLAHIYDPSLPLLSEGVQTNAVATVRATKPKSRTMNFRLGVGLADKVGAADRAAALTIDNRVALASPDLTRRSVLAAANRHAALAVDARQHLAAPDLSRRNAVAVAGRMAGLQIHRALFEASP